MKTISKICMSLVVILIIASICTVAIAVACPIGWEANKPAILRGVMHCMGDWHFHSCTLNVYQVNSMFLTNTYYLNYVMHNDACVFAYGDGSPHVYYNMVWVDGSWTATNFNDLINNYKDGVMSMKCVAVL